MNDFTYDNSVGGAFATIGDNGQPDFVAMNKGITPLFFVVDLPDEAATEKAGTLRTRQEEQVKLLCAGDSWSQPVHPVDSAIKERFAEAYARWKLTRTNDHIDGTPLAEWPQANRGFVMEMKALNIRSVEDLSSVSDANINRILNGRVWRDKAVAWLATSKDAGAAARYAAENARLVDEMGDLKRQLAELGARLDARDDDAPPKRGPGRPPKAQEAA